MAGIADAAPVIRFSKKVRREQLLDVAAEIVVDRGVGGVTMEGLAERAGVSKALPYQHFENASAVLAALYRREIDLLARRVYEAVHALAAPDERVRAAIHAYFEVVVERGRVLGALSAPGVGVAAEADDGARAGVEFVASLLVEPFGFTGKKARVLASMFLGTLSGAMDSWAHGDGGRARIEQTLTGVIVAGLLSEQRLAAAAAR